MLSETRKKQGGPGWGERREGEGGLSTVSAERNPGPECSRWTSEVIVILTGVGPGE